MSRVIYRHHPRCSTSTDGLCTPTPPQALAVLRELTLRWKQATMGSFFMVSCFVDSW